MGHRLSKVKTPPLFRYHFSDSEESGALQLRCIGLGKTDAISSENVLSAGDLLVEGKKHFLVLI